MRIILATIAFVMIGMPSWGYSSDLFSPSASDRIDNDNTSLNSLALCTVFRTLIISKDDIIEDDKANQIIVRFADGIPVAYQKVGLEANEHITNAQFRMVYDNMLTYVEPSSIPQLVLILADYSYKDSFVADHELNVVACMTEIMSQIKFK